MRLEHLAKTAVAGWGDRVFVGVLMGYLEGVSCQRCLEYIRENIDLMTWVSDKKWRVLRRMAKEARITGVTAKEIIIELQKRRADLVDVIRNHPEGMKWLNRQLDEMKRKLTATS